MKPHQAGTINNKQFTDEASWWFGIKSPTKTVFCNSQKSSRSISVNYIVQTQHSTLACQQNWMKLWLCVFWDAFLSLNIPYIRSFDQSGASMPRLRPTTANGWCQRQSSSPWLRDPHITQPIRFQIREYIHFDWVFQGLHLETKFSQVVFLLLFFIDCFSTQALFICTRFTWMKKWRTIMSVYASAALRQEEFGVTKWHFLAKHLYISSEKSVHFQWYCHWIWSWAM